MFAGIRWINWLVISLLLLGFVFYLTFKGNIQNLATRTLSETEVTMNSVGIGGIRTNLDDEGTLAHQTSYLHKEEVLSNLIEDVVNSQKNLTYDLRFDYVFVDREGKVTANEDDIRGIMYRVQYVDEDGKVQGNSERHLMLHQMKE